MGGLFNPTGAGERMRPAWGSRLLLMLALCAGPPPAAASDLVSYVRLNVTIARMDAYASLALPRNWTAQVLSTQISQRTGVCPPGRYCPAYTRAPLLCPAGTYSTQTGLSQACSAKCPVNSYCSDPGTVAECPTHTTSPQGSVSKLDCACAQGYQCVYRKVVNLDVLLDIPIEKWLSDPALQQAFLEAVAAAASVPTQNVVIGAVLPHPEAPPGLGGNRRLLAMRRAPRTSLHVTVHGASALHDLDTHLASNPVLRGARKLWWPSRHLHIAPTTT